MATLWQDLKYALRLMEKNLAFTMVAVLSLALGIGANTAIFSVVNAVLLRPLAYQDSDRLAVILHDGRNPVNPANFFDWRRQSKSFEAMGAAEYWTPNITRSDSTDRINALHISYDVLPLLGVQPVLGRVFLAGEEASGSEHEAVLSYKMWQSEYGGKNDVIGQAVTLNGEKYTIVGVMPRGFQFAPFWATKAQLWAPLVPTGKASDRSTNSLRIFGRLKPGVTLAEAQAEMATISSNLEREFPGTNKNVKVVSLKEKVVGNVRPALLVLLAAVGFVLLIACANVAHMLLARSAQRQKEVALRTALGAARARVIRQFLTESIVLAVFGGAAGVLLAMWGIRVLISLSPSDIPRLDSVGLDTNVMLFVTGITVLAGIIFGLAPALRAADPNLSQSLKEGGRVSSEGFGRNRLRSMLVASEFMFALVLLVGAGLMIRSFMALQSVDPGFDPHNVLTMIVSTTGTAQAAPERKAIFFQQLVERAKKVPGVVSASAINHLPLGGDLWGRSFYVEGRPIPAPDKITGATYRVVMPGYFETMKIPMLRGRDVSESDTLQSPRVVVVNEFFAQHQWPGEDPIGKRFSLRNATETPEWLTVVGVAKNAVQSDWSDPVWNEIYLPYLQVEPYVQSSEGRYSYLTLVVRSRGDAAALAPQVRQVVQSLDKNVAMAEVQTMDSVVSVATAQPHFYMLLLACFATVALVLAGSGIYGVMSYSVARRTQEIGIRIALGAQSTDIVKMVVAQGALLAMVGVAGGVVSAFAVTRLMSKLLYGISPNDSTTFIAVAALLTAVALLACYIPARRASRVDPIVALRRE